MTRPLRVLLIEDTDLDAALLQLLLKRGGFDPLMTRVETESELREQLPRGKWDVIISDVNLPRFSAAAALEVLRELAITVPFFASSGGGTQDVAAELLSAGARGYFQKDETAKLIAAIETAIENDSR